jgi:hypothetical protein
VARAKAYVLQETREVLDVRLLAREDLLHESPRERVAGTEVAQHLTIGVDRHTLRYGVLSYHRLERVADGVLGKLRSVRPRGLRSGSPFNSTMRHHSAPLRQPVPVIPFLYMWFSTRAAFISRSGSRLVGSVAPK